MTEQNLLQIPQRWEVVNSLHANAVKIQNVQTHFSFLVHNHADYAIPRPFFISATVTSILGFFVLKPRIQSAYCMLVHYTVASQYTLSSCDTVIFTQIDTRKLKESTQLNWTAFLCKLKATEAEEQ